MTALDNHPNDLAPVAASIGATPVAATAVAATADLRDQTWIQLSDLVRSARRGQELLTASGPLLVKLLNGQAYLVAHPNASGNGWEMHFGPRNSTPSRLTIPEGSRSLCAWVMREKRSLLIDNLSDQGERSDAWLFKQGVRSAVLMPLILDQRTFGVIGVADQRQAAFDKDDHSRLEAVGRLLAPVLALEQTEQALARQRTFVASTFDTMSNLIVILSANGLIASTNQACRDISGFSEDELRGRTLGSALLLPEQLKKVEQVVEACCLDGQPVKTSAWLLTKQGSRRWVEWSFSALNGPDGNVECLVVSGIDLTARRLAEQKAARAEAEAREAQQSLEALHSELEQREFISVADVDAFAAAPVVARERRRNKRRPFGTQQQMAPLIGGRLPQRGDFCQIRCRDISACGFSFYVDSAPDYDRLVVGFGPPATRMYLIAEVMHVSSVVCDGQPSQLIGCRYLGRADY